MTGQEFLPAEAATSRPKVVLVAPDLGILGGQGVQARGILEGLRDEGIDVTFIAVNRRFPLGLGWIHRIPILRTVLNELFYIPALFALRRADVVHIFSASYWSFLLAPVPAIAIARVLGRRVILNYHSGEAEDHLKHWGILVHPWLRMTDAIVVPSRYLEGVFRAHGYRSTVVPNMIDPTSFRFRIREPIRPRLLSMRNLEQHYRIDNTILAFSKIKARYPEATLIIAGYGSDESRLKQMVAEQNIRGAEFRGRIEPEDMAGLCDEADVFVNSSIVDNQPLSILEAFAAGLAVVSTPTGDIRSMVEHGKTGWIVPPDDPQAMAGSICYILGHQEEARAVVCRARREVEKFTWPDVSHKWVDLYARA